MPAEDSRKRKRSILDPNEDGYIDVRMRVRRADSPEPVTVASGRNKYVAPCQHFQFYLLKCYI